MSRTKTYMDANTGIIRDYPASLAAVFPSLIEVDEDAPCYTCGAPEDAPTEYIPEADEESVDHDDADEAEEED